MSRPDEHSAPAGFLTREAGSWPELRCMIWNCVMDAMETALSIPQSKVHLVHSGMLA